MQYKPSRDFQHIMNGLTDQAEATVSFVNGVIENLVIVDLNLVHIGLNHVA